MEEVRAAASDDHPAIVEVQGWIERLEDDQKREDKDKSDTDILSRIVK
jgi:hypothetical protein